MGANVNSLMGIMNLSIKNPRMPNTNQSFVNSSMKKTIVPMETDACSGMSNASSTKYTITTMFTD